MRPLVLVEWVDSHSDRSGWRPLDELANEAEPLHCRSVGWVAARTDDMLMLVASVSGERNNLRQFATGQMAIPRRCIIKETRLDRRGRR